MLSSPSYWGHERASITVNGPHYEINQVMQEGLEDKDSAFFKFFLGGHDE